MKMILGAGLLILGFVIGKCDFEQLAWKKISKNTEKTIDKSIDNVKNFVNGKDTNNKKEN